MSGFFERGKWVEQIPIEEPDPRDVKLAAMIEGSRYRAKHMDRMRETIRFYRNMGVLDRLKYLISPDSIRR